MKERTTNHIFDGIGCLIVLVFFGFMCWGLWRLFVFEPRHTTTTPPHSEATVISTTTTTSTTIPATNIQMISQQPSSNGGSTIYHFTIDGNDCIKYNNDPIICKGYGR